MEKLTATSWKSPARSKKVWTEGLNILRVRPIVMSARGRRKREEKEAYEGSVRAGAGPREELIVPCSFRGVHELQSQSPVMLTGQVRYCL